MVVCFGYSFIPQFLDILQETQILTLIWPKSPIVNTLFGMKRGLALLPITFSYQTVVCWLGSSKLNPIADGVRSPTGCPSSRTFQHLGWNGVLVLDYRWYNVCQKFLVEPILPYRRVLLQKSFFSNYYSFTIFNNKGEKFDYMSVLTPDSTLDVEKYKNYSPLLQGPRIALCYALSFASISCVLVNAALFDGKWMLQRLRKRGNSEDDVHMRLMRKYKEVPEWWYQVLLAFMFAVSLASVVAWPTFLPWWGFIITMLIPIIFIIPIGIIQARTSSQIGLNVITEFVAGYLWPGKPVANTLVKIYGYMAMNKGLLFVSDLKFGHYMKIPPRAMFRFQILGSVISNFAALGIPSQGCLLTGGVISWLINSVAGFCDPDNKRGYTCPGLNVFFRATIIWGVLILGTSH